MKDSLYYLRLLSRFLKSKNAWGEFMYEYKRDEKGEKFYLAKQCKYYSYLWNREVSFGWWTPNFKREYNIRWNRYCREYADLFYNLYNGKHTRDRKDYFETLSFIDKELSEY